LHTLNGAEINNKHQITDGLVAERQVVQELVSGE